MLIFSLFILLLISNTQASSQSLWDLVVKQDQIVTTVEYNQRHLNIWREDNNHGFTRFYVTPLCVIETGSFNCLKDKYSKTETYALSFNLRLWDQSAANMVLLALKQKGMDAIISDIIPLPMQMVRLGIRKNINAEVDNDWRSNQDQPNAIKFQIYAKSEEFCQEMASDGNKNIENFIAMVKPYFEFTIIAESEASRKINITGEVIGKSQFFAQLINDYKNKSIVYLKSDDLEKLSREILQKVLSAETVTSDYMPSGEEAEIVKELFNKIQQQQISTQNFSTAEWESVFWDPIFSRPDIESKFLNEVFKYNDSTKEFIYNETKDYDFRQNLKNSYNLNNEKSGGGKIGLGLEKFNISEINLEKNKSIKLGQSAENSNDNENHKIDTISFDDFQKLIQEEHLNVQWTGTKYIPKGLTLYRINVRTLNNSGQIFFKRIIATKLASIQSIEIRPDSGKVDSKKGNESPIFYDDLQRQIKALSQCLEISNLNVTTQIENIKEELDQQILENFDELLLQNSNISERIKNETETIKADEKTQKTAFDTLNSLVKAIELRHNSLETFSKDSIADLNNRINAANEGVAKGDTDLGKAVRCLARGPPVFCTAFINELKQ